MTETEYHILFPKTYLLFSDDEVTFTINHVKSREISALYFKLHFYDGDDTEIMTYRSPRWIVDTTYSRKTRTVKLDLDKLENAIYLQIELITVGISSENPLYFNEVMFNEGGYKEYSMPYQQITDVNVGFVNMRYANFYNSLDENYLQVIRPDGDKIQTNKLLASGCTVIAPHFENESDLDDPINLFMEFINQTEQTIDVLR